jgi:hypothetical protein
VPEARHIQGLRDIFSGAGAFTNVAYGEVKAMRTLSTRLLVLALLALPTTAIALPLDQQAGATTPATTCTVLAGPVGGPGRLSGCTRSTTGGRGTFELATAGRRLTTDVVHWKNGGTTTFKFTNGATPAAPCPSGTLALGLSGRVTSSTGAAASIRGHVAATVCLPGGNGSVRLASGTVWTF